MPENQMGPNRMGFFFYDFQNGKVGGALVHNPDFHTPASTGSLIYLNCQPDLQLVLNKVKKAGGTILEEKKAIGQNLGFMAIIHDTEGNRVALHSMS
jgi:predicted enzyme related to lactoylglutathione lyase